MDGIIYLLNQSGISLAQANAEIERLRKELERLTTTTADTSTQPYSE